MSKAVVFAYSSVGCECLSVLLRRGVEVALVYTHEDDPNEEHWFESVYDLARSHDLTVSTEEPDISCVRAAAPDVIFSFYYRSMLPMSILNLAPLGAFNMHGSLLPRYRGRACVNWAVLNGETETGVTLHHMTEYADRGNIVAQQAVPIGPDETAHEVFLKIIPAAGKVLDSSLSDILSGNAPGFPQDESKATKFGRRRPADGLIDWTKSAAEVHNLVRAVTKPFPGAFTFHEGHKLMIWRSRPLNENSGAQPGTFLSPSRVQTGQGILEILDGEDVDGRDKRLHARCVVIARHNDRQLFHTFTRSGLLHAAHYSIIRRYRVAENSRIGYTGRKSHLRNGIMGDSPISVRPNTSSP